MGWHRGCKVIIGFTCVRSGDRSLPDAHLLTFSFFVFCFGSRNMHPRVSEYSQFIYYTITLTLSAVFRHKKVNDYYIVFIIIFNSTMHYHKLHFSTQAKHTCHNCLISDAVCLDILKLQVQTNSSWPGVNLGQILLGHKLFVCSH